MKILPFLVLDVLLNHLVGNGARGRSKVAPSPEVSSPESFANTWEELEQFVRALALDLLHDVADGEMGWIGGEEMNMVRGHFAADDMDIQFGANPSNEIPHRFSDRTHQNLFAIFGNPD